MKKKIILSAVLLSASLGMFGVAAHQSAYAAEAAKSAEMIPAFKYDPEWPKVLPNNWILGVIGAVFVDKQDHVWIAQRPATSTSYGYRDLLEGKGTCCTPAPPVIEFDMQGNVLNSWGPIHINDTDGKTQKVIGAPSAYPDGLWPSNEHTLYIDHKNNIWLSTSNEPSQLVKFTHDGKFLMRIGQQEAKSVTEKTNLAGTAGVYVDPKTNEIFVADGYRNRRVVVFDADTGAFKRMWGAYGKPPQDPQSRQPDPDMKKRAEQFELVHCIVSSNDGLLYVCDRPNSRIQVFKKDGTFVREAVITMDGGPPNAAGLGTAMAIAFSPDAEQKFMYLLDAPDKKILILRRSDMKVVGSFGSGGRMGGQLLTPHAISTDSKGNVYVGGTLTDDDRQMAKNSLSLIKRSNVKMSDMPEDFGQMQDRRFGYNIQTGNM